MPDSSSYSDLPQKRFPITKKDKWYPLTIPAGAIGPMIQSENVDAKLRYVPDKTGLDASSQGFPVAKYGTVFSEGTVTDSTIVYFASDTDDIVLIMSYGVPND